MLESALVGMLDGLGVVSLVAVFGLLLAVGRLYTKGQVDRMEKAANAAIEKAEHDRDEWRAESRIKDTQLSAKDAQITEKDKQLRAMGEVADLQHDVLSALKALPHASVEEDR